MIYRRNKWSKWTGSVHQNPKGETHPCDDGSSGPAQRHQQEGEQHGPEAHDSNRYSHHLQHHCQKFSPWHLTLHPWCRPCQREGPTLCRSLYPLPTPTWSLSPSLPHVEDRTAWSAQERWHVAPLAKCRQTKVCLNSISACHDMRPSDLTSVSGWTGCDDTNHHQNDFTENDRRLGKHRRSPSIIADCVMGYLPSCYK